MKLCIMAPTHSRKTPFFKTKVCPWYFKNRCTRGDECLFAHSSNELRGPPNLAKTSMCPSLKKKGSCSDQECSFAHTFNELRGTDDLYKTLLCVRFLKGRCSAGDSCRYAHGETELRAVKKKPNEDINNEESNIIQQNHDTDGTHELSKEQSNIGHLHSKTEDTHHYYKFRDHSDRTHNNESNHHIKDNKKSIFNLKQKSYSYSENQWATLTQNKTNFEEVELIEKEISHLQELKKKAIASQISRPSPQDELAYTAAVNLFHNNPPQRTANSSLSSAFKSLSIQNQTENLNQYNRSALAHDNLLTDTPVFTPSHPQLSYLNEYFANRTSLTSPIDGNRTSSLTRSSSSHIFSSNKESLDPNYKISLPDIFYSSLPSTTWVSDGPPSPKSEANTLTNLASKNTFSSFGENEPGLQSYSSKGQKSAHSRILDQSMAIPSFSSQLDLNRKDNRPSLNSFEPLPGTFLETLYREIEQEANKSNNLHTNTVEGHLRPAQKYSPFIF